MPRNGLGAVQATVGAAMIAHLAPIQAKYHEVLLDRTYLESVLRTGREKAEAVADQTLATAKQALGFSRPL